MPYMLLILEEPGQRATRSEAQGREVYDRMLRYAADLKRRGVLQAVESLSSAGPESARVQVRASDPRVVDGPFAEAKEMVGGFFVVDVPTRDEAVALALECPAAAWATVEVRSLGPCFT
ncbi:MAG TPA: YciI family protein [Ramlibacter sp.]|jgi:hypothetical protein|uniref:YciI family protein n=1 Tax=Ramlibacter sp. TaxID=1917967 RepID=UPI002D2868F9|nr:YciI family protein [Ramlibacter sp.]HZY17499.1 YciI family protein [Ramlibacter sp.]